LGRTCVMILVFCLGIRSLETDMTFKFEPQGTLCALHIAAAAFFRIQITLRTVISASWGEHGPPGLITPRSARAPYPPTSILMSRKNSIVATPRTSTRGEAAIREFTNSNSTPEQLRQRAPVLLNNKELLRNVPALAPVEQTRFLDKVDQVCRSCLPKSQLNHPCKDISYYRPAQRKFRKSLGGRLQCNRAPSNLSRAQGGTRETWHHCRGVGGVHGHLARRIQWCPGSYQSLSHISRPKFERGKGGKHTITIGGPLSLTNFPDPVETGPAVAEAIP